MVVAASVAVADSDDEDNIQASGVDGASEEEGEPKQRITTVRIPHARAPCQVGGRKSARRLNERLATGAKRT